MIHPLSSSGGRNDAYVVMESVKFRGQTGVGCSDEQSDTIFPLPTPGDIVRLRSGDRVLAEIRLIEAA